MRDNGEYAGQQPSRKSQEDGFALIVVLWIVVVLALQVSVFNASVRDGILMADTETALARGQSLMHAAVEIAASRIQAADQRERWLADGSERQIEFADASLRIRILDENGRVDINTSDPRIIAGLMRSVTGDEREAQRLADRVLDWRDSDSDRREQGAEDRDYRRAGLDWGAADEPFRDTEDLRRVLGMTAQTMTRLLPLVTVYSKDGKINPLTASDDVLRALPGVRPDVIEQILRLRSQGGEAAAQIPTLLGPAQAYLASSRGPAYRIAVEVKGRSRPAHAKGEAIIALGLDAGNPYRVLGWRLDVGGRSGEPIEAAGERRGARVR